MQRDFSMPQWADEFARHGIALRLASVFLRLTKEELASGIEDMERDFVGEGPGPTFELVDCLGHAKQRLFELAALLTEVERRQLCAAAVVELRVRGSGVNLR